MANVRHKCLFDGFQFYLFEGNNCSLINLAICMQRSLYTVFLVSSVVYVVVVDVTKMFRRNNASKIL